jgi:hypothetical protein
LKADLSLAETSLAPVPESLLILPTGGDNSERLRRDARVQSLVQNFSTSQAQVAVTDNESNLLDDLYRAGTTQAYRPNTGQPLADFVDILAARVAFAW